MYKLTHNFYKCDTYVNCEYALSDLTYGKKLNLHMLGSVDVIDKNIIFTCEGKKYILILCGKKDAGYKYNRLMQYLYKAEPALFAHADLLIFDRYISMFDEDQSILITMKTHYLMYEYVDHEYTANEIKKLKNILYIFNIQYVKQNTKYILYTVSPCTHVYKRSTNVDYYDELAIPNEYLWRKHMIYDLF